jgi:hypothetical protein
MSYTISMNGVALEYLPVCGDYSAEIVSVGGGTGRAIDGTLVDLGSVEKERRTFVVVVGNQRAWLKGLKSLASFPFVDYDGTTYTMKMIGLVFNSWPLADIGTAQISLEEV